MPSSSCDTLCYPFSIPFINQLALVQGIKMLSHSVNCSTLHPRHPHFPFPRLKTEHFSLGPASNLNIQHVHLCPFTPHINLHYLALFAHASLFQRGSNKNSNYFSFTSWLWETLIWSLLMPMLMTAINFAFVWDICMWAQPEPEVKQIEKHIFIVASQKYRWELLITQTEFRIFFHPPHHQIVSVWRGEFLIPLSISANFLYQSI